MVYKLPWTDKKVEEKNILLLQSIKSCWNKVSRTTSTKLAWCWVNRTGKWRCKRYETEHETWPITRKGRTWNTFEDSVLSELYIVAWKLPRWFLRPNASNNYCHVPKIQAMWKGVNIEVVRQWEHTCSGCFGRPSSVRRPMECAGQCKSISLVNCYIAWSTWPGRVI